MLKFNDSEVSSAIQYNYRLSALTPLSYPMLTTSDSLIVQNSFDISCSKINTSAFWVGIPKNYNLMTWWVKKYLFSIKLNSWTFIPKCQLQIVATQLLFSPSVLIRPLFANNQLIFPHFLCGFTLRANLLHDSWLKAFWKSKYTTSTSSPSSILPITSPKNSKLDFPFINPWWQFNPINLFKEFCHYDLQHSTPPLTFG